MGYVRSTLTCEISKSRRNVGSGFVQEKWSNKTRRKKKTGKVAVIGEHLGFWWFGGRNSASPLIGGTRYSSDLLPLLNSPETHITIMHLIHLILYAAAIRIVFWILVLILVLC